MIGLRSMLPVFYFFKAFFPPLQGDYQCVLREKNPFPEIGAGGL